MPVPSWLTEPAPEMALERESALVWLKLTVPEPLPKAIVDALMDPALLEPPKAPIFSVPVEPFDAAIVMPLATTDPPLAAVRVPPPALPIVRLPLLFQMELLPVTRTELFEAAEV